MVPYLVGALVGFVFLYVRQRSKDSNAVSPVSRVNSKRFTSTFKDF